MDFNHFISFLDKKGQLRHLSGNFHGPEIADAASRACRENLPAMYINTDTSDVPLVLNLYASMQRLETAWDKSYDYLAFAAYRATSSSTDNSLRYTQSAPYRKLGGLSDLPLIKYHDCDTNVCIAMGCVITEDDDRYACGMYRVEPMDGGKAIIHCRRGSTFRRICDKKQKGLKVTVAVGCSPFLAFTSVCKLPEDADKLRLAAKLGDIDFIETEGHPVPSDTNVIIQGHLTGEMAKGGSFYNHTGSCIPVDEFPVIIVDSVDVLVGGVFQSTVTGKPPMEDVYLGQTAARVHFHRMKSRFAEITDIWHPVEGVFGTMCYIRATGFPDELREALVSDFFYGKFKNIFIFSDDTDIRSASDIMWRLANKVDFRLKRDDNIIIAY